VRCVPVVRVAVFLGDRVLAVFRIALVPGGFRPRWQLSGWQLSGCPEDRIIYTASVFQFCKPATYAGSPEILRHRSFVKRNVFMLQSFRCGFHKFGVQDNNASQSALHRRVCTINCITAVGGGGAEGATALPKVLIW